MFEKKNKFLAFFGKKFFYGFLFFFFVFLFFGFFYLNSQKEEKIFVSGNWYNLSQKKYIDEKNPEFNNGDLIQRTIILRNDGFFDVKNFLVEDFNPFTKSNLKFFVDIGAGKIEKKTYKIIASKIENFSVNLKTEKKEIQKNISKPKIGKKEKSKPFWSITGISSKKINNNFDNYFEVFGKNLNSIENILIDCGKKTEKFKIAIPGKNKVAVQISAGSLSDGVCRVGTFFNGITFFSDFYLRVEKTENNLGVIVKNISPKKIFSEKGGNIVFQGKGFKKIVAVQLDNGTILDLNFLKIVNDNVLIVKIPKKIKQGEYFFRLLTKNGVLELKNLKIKIAPGGE